MQILSFSRKRKAKNFKVLNSNIKVLGCCVIVVVKRFCYF